MTQACYTCRRRHIQCDRSAVPCAKCQKAGLQCLDKRPVRWVQGVAIRGGMRGRSFENSLVSSSPVGKIDICSTPANNLQSPTPTQHHAKLPTSLGELSPLLQRHDAIIPVRPALPSVPVAIGDAALAGLNSTARYYLDYCMLTRPAAVQD
jgi:hypothetical protein